MSEVDVVPLQFVQFTNDVLFVSYSDGSSLQLSPCGNQFVHELPADSDAAAFSGFRRVQQKTEFATSAFRAKVREALQFRNMFAEHPFLCSLLDGEEDDEDVENTVRWPTDVDSVVVTPNGRLQLQADSPQSCVVHLSANRQEFRSEFCVRPPNSLRAVRVTGHHSLRSVHRCWRPAVNLILRAVGIPSEEDANDVANLFLPSPLPLRCPRQHLHRFEASIPSPSSGLGWLLCGEGKRLVKVLCLEGVLYRLHLPPHLSVEIFPGDGSLLVSNNLTGCFFTHFIPTTIEEGEELPAIVERVYSSSSPPPSHPHKVDYDLGRVLAFGARLAEYLADCLTIMGNDDLDNPSHCCWRSTQGEEELEREFERVLGRRSRTGEKREVKGIEKCSRLLKEDDSGSERSLPRQREDGGSERGLPRQIEDGGSERSLPRQREDGGSEWSLPRHREDGGSERGLPRQREDGGSERGLPRQREDGGSERSLPRQREDGGSERSLPRQIEDGGSERGLPRQREDGGSERSLPRQREDGGSERGLPRHREDGGSERSLPRLMDDRKDWKTPAERHEWRYADRTENPRCQGMVEDFEEGYYGTSREVANSESEEEEDEDRERIEDIKEVGRSSRRILDKQEVLEVGTFTAGVAGRIHILFVDRVSLDMRADLSRRLLRDSLPLPPPDACPDLPPLGYVRVFTREGKFETVPFHDPFYARYINAAQEWIDWVNASIEERRVFYTERPQLPCPSAELKKIECFNYILDHSKVKPGVGESSKEADSETSGAAERARQIKSIEDTLARTSNFLRELETLRSSQR